MPTAPDTSALYRTLFAASPDALLVVDGGGVIVLANAAAENLLGYEPDALAGLSVDALVPESIRPRHAAYRQGYAQQPRARPMGTTQAELVARCRDGSEVMVEISLSPIGDVAPPLVLAAIRGIADYPRVKQALMRARYAEQVARLGRLAVDVRDPQLLIEQAPQIAAETFDADGVSLFLLEPDGMHLRLAGGHGPAGDEPVGWRMLPPAGSPVQHVLTHNEAVVVEDARAQTRFEIPPAVAAAGLRSALLVPISDRGHPVGVLALRSKHPRRFGADETRTLESMASLLATSLQRAQSEEALNHAQRLESVGQLTGGIAHDFNNLLTVIQGNLQVIEELPGVDASGVRPLAESALRASKRAAELTAKLLAFSRRQTLQAQRVDVVRLLDSLADMLRRTLDQRIRIDVDVAAIADAPACHVDPGQLEAALLNIAINTRDAMPQGGLLSFTAVPCVALPRGQEGPQQVSARPQDFVTVTIADTGVGMSEEVRERAFEPFFTTKESGRGTGLGLSTVYGFVRQSRGLVELSSTPGQGTTVKLHLPVWREAIDSETDSTTAPGAAQRQRPSAVAPGTRVLLVEDDAEVRQVISGFLRTMACAVEACHDAEQALGLLGSANAPFDMLVSDIALGSGMRGTELAQRVNQTKPAMAVVLMSGYSQERSGANAAASASTDRGWTFLPKPCTRAALAAAMVRALEQAQSLSQSQPQPQSQSQPQSQPPRH
jgi:PAS domain S-box-containing protein